MSQQDSISEARREAELPPTDEQMSEIFKLQRMRDEPGVSVPLTRAEAEAEIRRLWAS